MNYGIFRNQPIMTINDLAQIGLCNKRDKKDKDYAVMSNYCFEDKSRNK